MTDRRSAFPFSRPWLPAAALWCAVLFGGAARAATIHVPADQPTIQQAIDAAANGDVVLVSPGTYKGKIDFAGKAIMVASSDGPAVTILDGELKDHVVVFHHNEGRSSVLTGFTVRNGRAYPGSVATYEGGGVLVYGTSPTVRGNVVVANSACGQGPGIYVEAGAPLISGNLIDGNYEFGCGGGDAGGGIAVRGASPEIVGNAIAANSFSNGGGIGVNGGGGTIRANAIVANSAYSQGGGVDFINPSTVSMTQNWIVGNSAYQGGGVYWDYFAPAAVVANTVAGNAAVYGSGIYVYHLRAPLLMKNNLVVGETGTPAIGCRELDSTNVPDIRANDVYSLFASAYDGCLDPTGTAGNISLDPLFVSPLGGDFHLLPSSPAVDAGDADTTDLPTVDADGDPRVLDGDGDSTAVVDIGADELSANRASSIAPAALSFAPQLIGTKSAPLAVNVQNGGASPFAIAMIAAGGAFSQTNDCGAVLNAGASCQVLVRFAPTERHASRSVLAVMTDAAEMPLVTLLSGSGTAPELWLEPIYGFVPQLIGTSTTTQAALINRGDGALSIASIGADGDFSESDDCPRVPSPLAPGGSCTVNVTFTPTATGPRQGTLTVVDSAAGSPHGFPLYGSGLGLGIVGFSSPSVSFPDQLVGTPSAPAPVTVTNTGTGPLGITDVRTSGDFEQSDDCPALLAVGASCTVQLTFAPGYVGFRYGTLSVINDSAGSPADLSTSGHGVAGVPILSRLAPDGLPAGSDASDVYAIGAGLVPGSVLRWNGTDLSSSFFSANLLRGTVPATLMSAPGQAQVSMFSSGASGGMSQTLPFTTYVPRSYAVAPTSYAYRAIAGTNLHLSDDSTARVDSPFPILFGGGRFASFWVGSNGVLSFSGPSNGDYGVPLPDAATLVLAAPLWRDLYPYGTGNDHNVFWAVTGQAPDRELVVEWRNVNSCCSTSPTSTVTFEVVLFEGKRDVLFNYADVHFGDGTDPDAGGSASIGVQVAKGMGTSYSYQSPSLSDGLALLFRSPAARGDVNDDGTVGVADVFALIDGLFAGGTAPASACAADVNGDGSVGVADVFALVNELFAGAPAWPVPCP